MFSYTSVRNRDGRGMGRKKASGASRQLNVRVPVEMHDLLADVAGARNIDVSAVVNQVLAEARPGLAKWLREYRESLADALLADKPPWADVRPDDAQQVQLLRALSRELDKPVRSEAPYATVEELENHRKTLLGLVRLALENLPKKGEHHGEQAKGS